MQPETAAMTEQPRCPKCGTQFPADSLRQLIHEFAWGRMDVLAYREAARIDAETAATGAFA